VPVAAADQGLARGRQVLGRDEHIDVAHVPPQLVGIDTVHERRALQRHRRHARVVQQSQRRRLSALHRETTGDALKLGVLEMAGHPSRHDAGADGQAI